MAASPMTYELDGRQYFIAAVQDALYAFALPQNTAMEGSRAAATHSEHAAK
jgi:hypothetical protein